LTKRSQNASHRGTVVKPPPPAIERIGYTTGETTGTGQSKRIPAIDMEGMIRGVVRIRLHKDTHLQVIFVTVKKKR
jgi:hypothetical protein